MSSFPVHLGSDLIRPASTVKNLGVIFDSSLTYSTHINHIKKLSYFHLRNISRVRSFLSFSNAEKLVHAFITSRIDYCNSLLAGAPSNLISQLQLIQNSAARVLTRTSSSEHITPILLRLHWLPVSYRIEYKILLITYKALNNLAPNYISGLLHHYVPARPLRSSDSGNLVVPLTNLHSMGDRAFRGFSETYAALCDYNEFSCREEIQWVNGKLVFILPLHLFHRDVALAVAALSFNQWFTKIYCKDFKLSFSFCFFLGLNALGQALTTNKSFSNSLRYLDLSGNPGLLSTEEDLFLFLSCSNILTHLDLSATDCPLPPLFVALSVGCCSKLSYLNVSRNIYSHKKARDIPESLKDFFCGCKELKFMGFSGTKIPSECSPVSPGAQVIQDHIFEVNAIGRLDLSDNGFDSDMVTLVLSIGRSQSIRHLSLGKNFGMKALADVLHRIVQLIQEEECPLESLSVAESRLKTGTNVLITALGSNNSLTKIDISGNYMGDMGAKMLAKALQVNTTLGTVIWDRNNTSAAGFLDVAHALERNYTLKCMPIPINDVSQAYRNNPEKTEEAVQKIQAWLQRNNQRQTAVSERAFRLQQGIMTSTSEQVQCNQGELDADSQQEDTKGSGGSDQLSVSRPLTKSRPASSEDAALSNSLPPSSEPASPQRLMDLPIEGQRLQHYTRARPRPNRRNKQPPSKPNVRNLAYCKLLHSMFLVTALIYFLYFRKFLQPVKVQDPVCSTPPSGTRTIKKKFGDFFAFKKPRSSRGQKGEGAPESSPSGGLRLKKTSIADLIRPLREAARAAEKAEESAAKVSTIASTTGPTAVTGTTTTTTATTTTTPTTTTESPAGQLPIRVDREKSKTLESDREKSKTPDAERKLKPSRRSLREGKSQSLILLTGVDEEESLAASHGKVRLKIGVKLL
uniref:Capping protein regulator and myosin 1 linker 2 n=1 Tax=Erpetoichthys calabaricus TaxID=27687 RepID=A0A8C4X7K9_ERPCA